jgi:hypothetical protein
VAECRRAFLAVIANSTRRLPCWALKAREKAGEVRIAEALSDIGYRRVVAHQRIGRLEQTKPPYRVRERLTRHRPNDAMPVMGRHARNVGHRVRD